MRSILTMGLKLSLTVSFFGAYAASAARIVEKEEKKTYTTFVQVVHLEIPCTLEERTVYDSDGYHPVDTETVRVCQVDSLKNEVQEAMNAQKLSATVLTAVPADDASREILEGNGDSNGQKFAVVRVKVVFEEK
jgi:hypothetical protein